MTTAVNTIKTAILQSQSRAVKSVNQEQLTLYYGIGRYISENTRNKNWGMGVLKGISERLKLELPGLRGFGVSSLKNMRAFYEAWTVIEQESPIMIGELADGHGINMSVQKGELEENIEIRQLQVANFNIFP